MQHLPRLNPQQKNTEKKKKKKNLHPCLSFFICKLESVIVPTLWDNVKDSEGP